MIYQGNAFKLALHDDGIAELIVDLKNESVNKFNKRAVKELGEALDALGGASGVKGLLVTSAKAAFIVGADITEFSSVFAGGRQAVIDYLKLNNTNLNRLEDLPVPTVVAINGHALGGGMEFCLACDFRVADTNANVGLPETKLGILPGWGGTVRLPRLAGLDTAVEWIASGQDNKAQAALTAGVVDAVVEPDVLRQAALKTLHHCIEGKLDYRARRQAKTSPLRHNAIEAGLAFESSIGFVAAKAGPNYPSPVAAIKVMRAAADKGRDDALALEAETFADMAVTGTAHALVGIFVNDQAMMKKAKGLAGKADAKVERAAVLGAGIMGGGIAYQSALRGVPVTMKDIAQEGLDLGLKEARKLFGKRVERGKMSAAEQAEGLTRIKPALSYDAFDQVDLVVEAVVENAKVKRSVLAETEKQVTGDTVLTSNTSTISIDHLAGALNRPENFCGMHFFNPVPVMPLVEVIRGRKTSDAAVARTVAYALALGKKPVVVKDCPGFLVNRVLFPYFEGFSLLVRDGVDFERIDKVMERWGWPMGPAYLLDVVGIDTAVHAHEVMAEGYPERMRQGYTSAIAALFKAERYGQKNGAGFYDYEEDKKGKPRKTPSARAHELIKPHVTRAPETSDEEIVLRMLLPMLTELVRCLEEGIVASAAEADMALVYGVGFPPFRGGLLHWADTEGAQALCDSAATLAGLGPLYEPPAMLKSLAREGDRFHALSHTGQEGEQL
ncbi:fatty acid oxidation complex subunit alpha FadB [Marinimicrobium alkaliphilum]|uniref:fatty acid oxidation complex subunit alpha FadB n=1 Tax=Marinimicrobium alkaliphilum TaxID=2202654 RepID=UPI000DB95C1F|nr:fatty acid oxidation complex subunit alpha FadB [Marinimicrobium alkaliphilum]